MMSPGLASLVRWGAAHVTRGVAAQCGCCRGDEGYIPRRRLRGATHMRTPLLAPAHHARPSKHILFLWETADGFWYSGKGPRAPFAPTRLIFRLPSITRPVGRSLQHLERMQHTQLCCSGSTCRKHTACTLHPPQLTWRYMRSQHAASCATLQPSKHMCALDYTVHKTSDVLHCSTLVTYTGSSLISSGAPLSPCSAPAHPGWISLAACRTPPCAPKRQATPRFAQRTSPNVTRDIVSVLGICAGACCKPPHAQQLWALCVHLHLPLALYYPACAVDRWRWHGRVLCRGRCQ